MSQEEQVPKKSGPFTSEEINFIKDKATELSAKEIATRLGRNVNTINSYLQQITGVGSKADILNLKKRQDWKTIQKQLSPDELETFEWHWNNIVKQFKDEIYHTEGMQVVNAIKHEILANRMLTDQQKIITMITRLDEEIIKEQASGAPDNLRISNCERQIASLCAAQEVNNKEYRENSKKLGDTLQQLKSTREQRITKVEDAKKNFSAWMTRILEDAGLRKDLGVSAEKMRLAKYEELKRLAKPFKFADGSVDRPILNCETVEGNLDEEESEGEEN